MRKRRKGRTLSRVSSQRKALLRTLLVSLVENNQIKTTLAKARELRPFAERKVTLAKKGLEKDGQVTAIRELKKELPAKTAGQLIALAETFKERAGGYTRIIKLPNRKSDGAQMALIELVGTEKEAAAAKTDAKKEESKSDKKEKESTKC